MIDLILQTQPTPVTCVHTCLAMALSIPVKEVIAHYGPEPMNQQKLCTALSECSVLFNQFVFGTILIESWYFASVPSLNIPGGMHQILFRWQAGKLTVLDPSAKRKYAMDGSDLKSWSDLTPFWPGGALPR